MSRLSSRWLRQAQALDEMMRNVQEATSHAGVSFHETDISKDGGKILLVGGAPKSEGNDEERMLRAVREIMDRAGKIPMRVGVNAGRVFSGDFGPAFRRSYSIKGDAVNLAARIMGKSELGQVLVTAAVLDPSPTAFQTTALEPFLVKGKKLLVQAYILGRAIGSKADEEIELPLVGRDAEMETVLGALDAAASGAGKVVEIIGPPGIGKTRLLHELEEKAVGWRTFKAPGDPYEAATPYRLVKTVLRQVLEAGEDTPSVPELQDLGVARVSYGAAFARHAITAVKELAETLLETGDPRSLLRGGLPRAEYQGLLRGSD